MFTKTDEQHAHLSIMRFRYQFIYMRKSELNNHRRGWIR